MSNAQLAPSSSEISIQATNPAFPLSVAGGDLYYQWEFYNGTARITWSGKTLEPTNMVIQNSDEGLDTTLVFAFSSDEWSVSATFLGYPLTLAV
ncbi:MAG: hypothetical protein ACTSRG_13645 [Candidatus Helarchaeota archaeon]